MVTYYVTLALRSLRRNGVLTILMIAAIAVGIGASMTTLTVFRAMSGDPIPEKSARLFAVQVDNWGPKKTPVAYGKADGFQDQLSYIEAMNLEKGHAALRQSAMYSTGLALTPADRNLHPFQVEVRAAYRDFFPMFSVPFLYGAAWSASDDAAHLDVVVITRELNDKVFGGADSVGKTLNLDAHDYRVVGVLDRWEPVPRFYDVNNDKYGKTEQIFVPFMRAIDAHLRPWGNVNCSGTLTQGWEGRLKSECIWLQYWAELPSAVDAAQFRSYLNNYAADQRARGRFDWPPHVQMRNVREWLVYQHAVSDEVRILVLVSFSFLFVCLLNATGLMLARIMSRRGDIGVRRALGANRAALYWQCLIEAAVIGVAGGLMGLGLTLLGLSGLRALLSEQINQLTHLDWTDMSLALALGVAAAVIAGLYPTWRAVHLPPAWQLKSQ